MRTLRLYLLHQDRRTLEQSRPRRKHHPTIRRLKSDRTDRRSRPKQHRKHLHGPPQPNPRLNLQQSLLILRLLLRTLQRLDELLQPLAHDIDVGGNVGGELGDVVREPFDLLVVHDSAGLDGPFEVVGDAAGEGPVCFHDVFRGGESREGAVPQPRYEVGEFELET